MSETRKQRTADEKARLIGEIEKLSKNGSPITQAALQVGATAGLYHSWKRAGIKGKYSGPAASKPGRKPKTTRFSLIPAVHAEPQQLVALIGSKAAILDAIRGLQ